MHYLCRYDHGIPHLLLRLERAGRKTQNSSFLYASRVKRVCSFILCGLLERVGQGYS